jgi:phytanoyl-CoA hydroxylase
MSMQPTLTPPQIEQYRTEGAIVVPDVVDALTLRTMKSALAQWVEASREVSEHTALFDLEPGHSRTDPRVRRIKKPHAHHPVFAEFARSAALSACLRPLLGSAARLHNSKLNLKAPRFGSPVEWHQDWAFYPHTNDDILAVGVMLDDTTEANGAMFVIPGSHKDPTHSHHNAEGYFCGAIDVEASGLNVDKRIACVGPAGSCSFHHVRAVHGSAQNTSDQPRGLLLYEIAAADAFPLMGFGGYDDFHARMLYGDEPTAPRFNPGHIRMPLPPAKNQGSIYENQTSAKRYFGFA